MTSGKPTASSSGMPASRIESRASSRLTSCQRTSRPRTREYTSARSAYESASGPVRTYALPSWPSPVRTRRGDGRDVGDVDHRDRRDVGRVEDAVACDRAGLAELVLHEPVRPQVRPRHPRVLDRLLDPAVRNDDRGVGVQVGADRRLLHDVSHALGPRGLDDGHLLLDHPVDAGRRHEIEPLDAADGVPEGRPRPRRSRRPSPRPSPGAPRLRPRAARAPGSARPPRRARGRGGYRRCPRRR